MAEPAVEYLLTMEHEHGTIMRKGMLRKRVLEDLSGEKPKCGMEKWQDSFVILTPQLLLAYKDAQQPHDNPNLIFDATQCKIRWSSMERSNKTNVFEVKQQKAVVLFYLENFQEANQWFTDLKSIEKSNVMPIEEFPDVAVDLEFAG